MGRRLASPLESVEMDFYSKDNTSLMNTLGKVFSLFYLALLTGWWLIHVERFTKKLSSFIPNKIEGC